MKKLKFNLMHVFISAILALSACQENTKQFVSQLVPSQTQETNAKLTMNQVDELMNSAADGPRGPNLSDNSTEAFASNSDFKKTPMGAYLQTWFPNEANEAQLNQAIPQIITQLSKSKACEFTCSKQFLDEISSDRAKVDARLKTVSEEMAMNEIKNHQNFSVFYHGFPNEFRLYQDVLRIIKSFEFLTKLNTTYPLRDLSFEGPDISLETFLKNWWPEYLKHAAENKVPPFPTKGYKAAGKSVGLTFFPDSILYASKHIISTNVNFLGNSLSPQNSSVFFFLNSVAATKTSFDVVDMLIKNTLGTYVLNEDGQTDEAKLATILANLKAIFERTVAQGGGQVAQIFVEKSATPEVSFMAWNGGEPLWISSTTGKHINAAGQTFSPPNVFWPDEKQKDTYTLFSVVNFMNLYIDDPQELARVFPIRRNSWRVQAAELLKIDVENPRVAIFNSQDYAQARILPIPKYFTDENITGVKIFSRNEISPELESSYNDELFTALRDVMADFLATAKVANFKAGNYKLKDAFIEGQSR